MRSDSKYVEVSAALNHKVDELLVGLVRQIRLNPERRDKHTRIAEDPVFVSTGSYASHTTNGNSSSTTGGGGGAAAAVGSKDAHCPTMAKGLLHKLFKKHTLSSKSCDNLLVL